jgi:hypothetical protein
LIPRGLIMGKHELVVLLAIAAAILMIFNLAISIKINLEIRKRVLDMGITDRNGFIFKYLRIFRDQQVQENGKPGTLYYLFIISIVLFVSLLFAGTIITVL